MKMPLPSPVSRLRIDVNDGPILQLATVLSITENVYSSLAWLPPEELAANEKNAVHRSVCADSCFAGFAEPRQTEQNAHATDPAGRSRHRADGQEALVKLQCRTAIARLVFSAGNDYGSTVRT